ncbi:MAG: glycosyltransferase [Pseudomonadota bacterium]|nr:glycosyltransferase [Pseudomonadota bacterium]
MKSLDQLRSWREAAPGFLRRQEKNLDQLRYGWDHPQQLCFVFGCQRSGTKMLMRVLDKSPATRIYHENNALAFDDFQLRSDRIVRTLLRISPAPSQIFKPICDSQEADRLLTRFPAAHGLWIYRHHDDVANSALHKWGAHQREVVAAVASGERVAWGWRTARLPDTVVANVRRVYRDDLCDDEGALLFWYLRNAFFFELGLHEHPRVLLVKYERMVQAPESTFPAVFAHVGAPFDAGFIERVHAGSVGRNEAPRASPEIRALCADLLARLDAWAPAPVPAAAPRPVSPVLVSPVLMLINTLGVGGAERYVVTVANWMAERGVDVAIAASPGELVGELLPSVGYVATPLRRVRGGLPLAALRVRGILRARRPAAIVANSLVVTWIARAAQVRRRVPIVTIAHGWPDHRYRRVGPLLRIADRVVAVSPEVKAKLVSAGLDPGRCDVIFNGVDCTNLGPRVGAARVSARAAMGAGPDDLVVVILGRLSAQKAHHHVIALAERLRERRPELRFAIVGEGARAEELTRLVRAAGLDDRVRLLGLRSDVPDLLGSADIYLSCSDWEGMPLSTIEAMAAALPTVATRTEGSGQLLTEDCGVVVPVGDVAAMAEAVERLAADAPLRARLGEASRRRALASFGHDRMARELAALVARVVSPERAP